MDKKIETGNITDNTGHASRNPNPDNPLERNPESRNPQLASRSSESNPVSRDPHPASSNTSDRNSTLESNPATRDPSLASRPMDDDEISLKDLILKLQDWWRYLLSKWLIILIVGLLGGALGLIYSIYKKPTYVATLTFVLEEESKGGLGNLGGLAAMAGISVGGGGGGIFQGDNILELYKSRSMLTKTLLNTSNTNDSLLIDRYITAHELREAWAENPKLSKIDFAIPQESFSLQHDSLIGLFVNNIKADYLKVSKPDKILSLIEVQVTTPNESFSKDFTEVLVQEVNDFYVETKTKKAVENLEIVQHQADSVRNELNAAIGGVASMADANPNANPARQVLRVPSAKRQVDVQANQAILTELVKNLEASKISLRRETPLIQIIDQPILPLKKERLGKAKSIVLGGLVSGFLIVLLLICIRMYKEVMIEE